MHFFKVVFFGWVFLDGLFWVFLGGFFWVGFLFAHPEYSGTYLADQSAYKDTLFSMGLHFVALR